MPLLQPLAVLELVRLLEAHKIIMSEHFFTTYVRTKTLFKNRLKDISDYDVVKIYLYELKKLGVDNGPILYRLRQQGEIWYDDEGNFKAIRKGPIDPTLLERTKKRERISQTLSDLHIYMRDQLNYVEVETDDPLPVYFKAFLKLRKTCLRFFFTVDGFSGRVHTPVVNLKGDLRKALRFHGKKIVSLDVKQMQPTILAKILLLVVGPNTFSDSIFRGDDVYLHLQKTIGLATRNEAKKILFKLIFGKPMADIGRMFKGDTTWVDWINSYKSNIEPKNPHSQDRHTNLAWLLQYSEVQIMTGIWNRLKFLNIPFLTIHDDILCMSSDEKIVFKVMNEELRAHFPKYTITVTY
jgi:hypothetical protein